MKDQAIVMENTIRRCRERQVIIPTYGQMRNPETVPEKIREKLKAIGLWDLNPFNLFRITWKNEPVDSGGGYGGVNYLEIPRELSGVKARILMLIGKFFPTGSHKVGATFGPLVEKLVTGRFDPTCQKALWPSTGNYCRGGAYDSYLLGCKAIAILPEEMSAERFDWLKKLGAEVFATPGCESNVKEIYDKAKALIAERGEEIVNLNQFEEFGNPMWHFSVTGPAMEEVFNLVKRPADRFSGVFLTQGSAGTLGSTDYLRTRYPFMKVCAGEALQCPTLLYNGYGGHRIEGIGDKHVPWVHNIRNMDLVAGIDDEDNIRLMRLFNEPAGREFLNREVSVDPAVVGRLGLLGISSIANLMGAVKLARYFEMDEHDVIFTVATDSMDMYHSRIREQKDLHGSLDAARSAVIYESSLLSLKTDHMFELSYYDKKRIHNLKYFTWVEQQGKTVEELNAQWYDEGYWPGQYAKVAEWDEKIREFNEKTGVLKVLLNS
jgi:cysteine synthase